MSGSERRRSALEGVLQTAAFLGALLVLAAVLYASLVVQGNRREEARRAETAQAVATTVAPAGPLLPPLSTPAAYPRLEPAPLRAVHLESFWPPSPDAILDPALAPQSTPLLRALFLGLTRRSEYGEVAPLLAESWEVSADGLAYTFRLRQDVFWVSCDAASGQVRRGRPVTAHDVAWAIERALRPEVAAPRAGLLDPIRGAQARRQGDRGAALGIEVLDDFTLRFTLAYAAADFPARLAEPVAWPVPREVVEARGDGWTAPGTIEVDGVFCPLSWSAGGAPTLAISPWLPADLAAASPVVPALRAYPLPGADGSP